MPAHLRSLFAAPLLLVAGLQLAQAEALDLSRASCADFVSMNENDRTQLSLWLAGYFAGVRCVRCWTPTR